MAAGADNARLEQLLAAARSAAAHGERALALRKLARLEASAGDDDVVATLAARVERRLQYAGIAGKP